jgi:hypothetical protein
VENEFVAYVAKSKRAAHRGDKYEFLLDAISHPNFDPKKTYLITELFELAAPISDETKRLQHSLGREGVRADLVALAMDAGYNLSIEKKYVSGDKRARYRFIFTPIQASEDDFLASLLREAGFTLRPDDDDATPPPESTPFTPAPTTPSNTPPLPDNPLPHTPSGNTMAIRSAGEAKDAVQDETKTEMDMAKKENNTSIQPEKSANQSAGDASMSPSASTPAPKADLKKAPPPSEWAYRAGPAPQTGNSEVSEGLFAFPQETHTAPTSAEPHSNTHAKSAVQKYEYPTDAELIEEIDKRLREQAEGGVTLEDSIDFLNRFLLRFEEEMWQVGLTKSLRYIQNRVIDLQNAINALGYDELTSEKDPRLRPAQNRPSRPDVYTEET